MGRVSLVPTRAAAKVFLRGVTRAAPVASHFFFSFQYNKPRGKVLARIFHGQNRAMFECRACLFRCLSAIAADLRPALHSYPIQRFRRASAWQQQRRKLGTVGATRKKSGIVTFDTFKGNAKYGPFTHLPKAVPMGLSSGQSTGSPPIKTRHINKELQYLSSPMRVADRVRDVLRKGNDEKAFALLQAASKSMSCIVGWNHLLDFHMSQERVKVALKIYNDVRQQFSTTSINSFCFYLHLFNFVILLVPSLT